MDTARQITAASLTALTVVIIGCADTARRPTTPTTDAGDTPQDQFLGAFVSEDYTLALDIADGLTERSEDKGLAHTYRGAALSALGRHEEAVESFKIGLSHLPPDFNDAMTHYMRATSLCQANMNGQGLRTLDKLARSFPHSWYTKKGQALAARVQSVLAAGASRENLNWYLMRGRKTLAAGRLALASEYLEEYLHLAALNPGVSSDEVLDTRMNLGTCYLELSMPTEALTHLEKVPATRAGYRAGLLYAMALGASGLSKEALEVLDTVIIHAERPTREDARKLMSRLHSQHQ